MLMLIGRIGMPGAEEGFKAAIVGILSGLILSILFNEVLRNLGFWGFIIAVLYNFASIISSIELIEDMACWSITYLIGWLIGLLLVLSLMEPLEKIVYILAAFISLIIKIRRKLE